MTWVSKERVGEVDLSCLLLIEFFKLFLSSVSKKETVCKHSVNYKNI